jgi:hypothetical protein|tara:strand:- start:79 stop:681 length:603 start_codon:yes stop_codon:yes gene_type:complete
MLSWNALSNPQPKKRIILKALTKKRIAEHHSQGRCGYTKFPALQISDELLDQDSEEKGSYIFQDTNYHVGNLKSDVYEKSLLQKTDYANSHPVTQKLNKHFGMTFGYSVRNIQQPGQVVGPHSDLNGDFSKAYKKDFDPDQLCKAMIFLDDWQLGQVLTFGKSALVDWKKYDCITFPWYIPHATANASTFDRPVLAYIGI